MKRDMDLVRELLLKIEAADEPPSMWDLLGWEEGEEDLPTDTQDKYFYHLKMLVDQGFVTGIDASSMSSKDWLNLELAWPGHDFLDNTRDSEVWKKTKSGIEKLGGAGWDVIRSLAVAYAKQVAKEKLGLDL
jgi:hypothetical protein